DGFRFERGLEELPDLSVEDRVTVTRIKQLQSSIQVDYALAHALKDLGRDREAAAQAAVVREPAQELTRLVRDLGARQAQRSVAAPSGEVARAMVESSGGAEQQRNELNGMGRALAHLQQAAAEIAEAATRLAQLGEEIRAVADRHRGDIQAASGALLDVREVVQTTSTQITQLAEQ